MTRTLLTRTVLLLALLAFALASCEGDNGSDDLDPAYRVPTRMVVTPTLSDDLPYYLFTINNMSGTMTVLDVRLNVNDLVLEEGDKDKDEDLPDIGDYPTDLAADPTGERVFVCNALGERMWVMEVPELTTRPLDIAVGPCEMTLAGESIAIADARSQKVLLLDLATETITAEAEIDGRPRAIAAHPDGTAVYVTTDQATITKIGLPGLETQAGPLFLDGDPTRMDVSPDGTDLYVVNRSPARMHRLDPDDLSTLAPVIDVPARPVDVLFTPENQWAYVDAEDSFVYVYDRAEGRFCVSTVTEPVFKDEGAVSDPVMEELVIEDCRVDAEEWTVEYDQPSREWIVEGDDTGRQTRTATLDTTYLSDDGSIQFLIRSGTRAPSDGDRFVFETDEGIDPLRVGVLPDGMVSVPDFQEPDYSFVFVANSLSDSLTEIHTKDHEDEGDLD